MKLAVGEKPPQQRRDSGTLSVRQLEDKPDLRADWDEFVRNTPTGTFFHLSAWSDLIQHYAGHRTHYLYAESNGRLCGVLPLTHFKSRLFGNALISSPFLVYGGPVARDATVEAELVGEACGLAKRLGVDYLELRNRDEVSVSRDWPTKSKYATFRKPLLPTATANRNAIPRKQRAMIRKGEKHGLRSVLDSDTRRLYALLSECKRNLGTPFFGHDFLQAVYDAFPGCCEVLTVMKGEEPVSSVMSFKFRDEILPYYGGGGMHAREVSANDFMYWAVMERACAEGFKTFDFGRSMEGGGPYRFKKHWGFEPRALHYQYYLVKAAHIPDVSPANPKYQLAVRTWQRLPLWLARTVGPFLARRLG